MTRVDSPLVPAPGSPDLRRPQAPTGSGSFVPFDQLETLATKQFSPLAAAMSQQLQAFDGEPSATTENAPSLNQLQHQQHQHHHQHQTLPHPHLAASTGKTFTTNTTAPTAPSTTATTTSAAAYAAMLEDFDRHRGGAADAPAVYSQRLWMQPREVNIVFGRDVIQVPLKVENSNNEYVNLVLSHREFDVMAVHISQYDEMHPSALLDEITRHLKEQADKQKSKRHSFGLNNQLGDFPDSNATFQARILELEYELSRLNTKLAAARAVQTTLTDENTQLRSNLRNLEQRCMENESLQMQNEVLRDQSVAAFAQNSKLKDQLRTTLYELHSLSTQMRSLRTQVHYEQSEVASQVDHSMNALIANVRDREHVLQESYLEEKKERQLIAEKYYEISGRIRVFCRLRPVTRSLNKSPSAALLRPKPNSLLVDRSGKEFSFDQVFGPENSQADVYSQMEPVAVSFADGYNACIMAYGQTGSGKTFTMVGGSGEAQGMIPRALQQVFTLVNARQLTFKDTLSVSMVEIYNDQVLDLLTEGESGVKIKNETDITLRSVTLWEHVNAVLAEGNANRNIASTSMNVESSRSHALVFLHLESQHRETLEVRKSTLCLVDLAGSERISRSQVEGERLKETQHINKSLSALGDVMHALQHKAKHVPYRNSKLTYMLREMLSGQAKTLMMLQLSPEEDDVEETICSLQFGARVSQIQMGAVKTSVESGEIFRLKEENRSLEKRLAQLEEQASTWKQESRSTQEELNEAKDRNRQLQNELGQHQEDMSSLQEKLESVAMVSASSASPPLSPRKNGAPLSPTLSANSARSSRSVTSTNSAPAATPSLSRYGTATGTPRPTRTSSIATGTVGAKSTLARPSARVPSAKETPGAASATLTPAERLARRKSLTTLNSSSTATVLTARERLASVAKEPLTGASRRATLGAIGSSASQPNLTAASRATPAGRIPRTRVTDSPSAATRPAPMRRVNSLATPRTAASAASPARTPTSRASAATLSSPSRTTTSTVASSSLRAPSSLEKRRSLVSSRSTPSTPAGAMSTARLRTAVASSAASGRTDSNRRPPPTFSA